MGHRAPCGQASTRASGAVRVRLRPRQPGYPGPRRGRRVPAETVHGGVAAAAPAIAAGSTMTAAAARPSLMIIDDDAAVLPLVERFARSCRFDVSAYLSAREAMAALPDLRPDAALVDLQMPELSGIDVLKEIGATEPDCQVILMTGNASVDTAIEAVKAGALDYLSKPLDFDRLRALLDGVRESRRRRERLLSAEAAVAAQTEFHGIIGRAAVMQQLFATIRRLAPHARTVLIGGETGTGKELVARAL